MLQTIKITLSLVFIISWLIGIIYSNLQCKPERYIFVKPDTCYYHISNLEYIELVYKLHGKTY